MYKPDRVISRKIREYDPYLFLEWNDYKQWFELWRMMPHGRRLITPVVQSIYDQKAPIKFCQLDERLLWWIYDADSWAHGGPKKHNLEADKRWKDWIRKKDRDRKEDFRDRAKEIYNLATSFYATKHASKNTGVAKFKSAKRANWIRPDVQARSSSRIFSRSRANALKYGFRK